MVAALKGALDRSGLFYESHLLQWFAGDRPLAALLREPQGRLSTATQVLQPSPEEPDPAPMRASTARVPDPGVPRTLAADSRGSTQPLDPQVLGQIRSQLEVIEQRQVLWQGQAWPGQALEWRIEEPPERGASPDEPTPWTTHLRLTLPQTGRSDRGAEPERRARARAPGRASRAQPPGRCATLRARSPRRCRTRDWC